MADLKTAAQRAYMAAYKAAQQADDRFRAAVVREFGEAKAGDMRYRSDKHTPAIKKLAAKKHQADERAHKALAKMRTVGGSVNPSKFEKCVEEVAAKGKAASPRGVCAAAGRKKYGKKRFASMAAAGRRKARMKPNGSTQVAKFKSKAKASAYADKRAQLGYTVHAINVTSDGYEVRWSKPKKKQNLSGGRPKLLTIVSQGRRQAHIFQVGKKFETRVVGDATKSFDSFDAAAKFARLRLHELPNPGFVQKVKGFASKAIAKLKGKANPESSAEEMYFMFHGLPAEKVLEYKGSVHVHEWLWALGTFTSMNVRNQAGTFTVPIKGPDPAGNKLEDVVMVAASEDGKQIYFVGGDQSLPLDDLAEKFGITEDDIRDHMKIGTVTKLTYRTRKKFEDEGAVNIDFYHKLGEEHSNGVLPDLVYKPLDPSLLLVGGRYKVAPFDKSLGASPGVVG